MTLIDDQLDDELFVIEKELMRRKTARPPEPFATWVMHAQMAALTKFQARQIVGASPAVAIETRP